MTDELVCVTCGQPLEWEDCWNGCEDGYLSLYDEDPLFYDEDDFEVCHACRGAGGWWVCPYAYKHEHNDYAQSVASLRKTHETAEEPTP